MAKLSESIPVSLLLGTACALLVSVVLRFAMLDADPHYYEWQGYIADEGRWVEHARRLALFDQLLVFGKGNIHLVLSPLYQAVNFVIFEIAGVSRSTTRFFSALCVSLVVGIFWWRLRRPLGINRPNVH